MSNGTIVSMTVKEAGNRFATTEPDREGTARNAGSTGPGAAAVTATKGTPERYDQLRSRIVERPNMQQAYRRVVKNRGAAGVDGMSVAERKDCLVKNWLRIKDLLLTGRYVSQAIRGANPETDRWCAAIGHNGGGGSPDPASHSPGALSDFRPDVFGTQLRISSGAKRASGSVVGPTICC